MWSLGAAVLLALLLAAPAAAHVSVRPALLSSPAETLLRIELPALRPGLTPSALDLSGPGVRVLSSNRAGRLGEESRWRVRIRIETEPGPLPLLLLAHYADGRSVRVRQTLTVVPASAPDPGEADPGGAPLAAIGGGLAVVLAGAAALALFARSHNRP